jgi:putative transposase
VSRSGGSVLLDVLAQDSDRGTCNRHDVLKASLTSGGEHVAPILGDENQEGVQYEDTMAVSVDIAVFSYKFEYTFSMKLRYGYRLDPWPRHLTALAKAFGCARVVYNDGLRSREAVYQAGKPYLTDSQMSARPKAGKPQFRSRKDHRQAIRFTANARFQVLPNGKLRLPKIGDVPVRWSRPLPCRPSSVTVIKDSAGRYFASFVVEVNPIAAPEVESVVGIDLGLGHFAVLSDGQKIDAPQFLRRAEKLLKCRQRELSRKRKGSRNRNKARLKVARAHAQVVNARRDFHHQLSTALIRDNQAIAVENLAVAALGRTRLAKSVYDAGWSGFVRMLEYKARLYGRRFHRTGRFTPTSQLCSACGVKDGPKPLHVRAWRCAGCGAWLDRDINAAVNVAKAAGLAVTACRAQVRPGLALAQRGEAGTLPKSHRKARQAGISALQGGVEVKVRL